MADKETWSRVPWSSQASLKLKTDEVGIDFDAFIEGLRGNRSDGDMAKQFNVPVAVISNLREQFIRFGVDSVQGRD
ncbi:MAG: helix-turn-helix domain-containing protein [Thermoanaerobacterales bacterium]|nr:helix-turn-helix domain-containing protein [Bacillota bacterium]MDI6907171.1 helix-turn-helix domain-containing protein [Thermoanaerobacterales bacterium]